MSKYQLSKAQKVQNKQLKINNRRLATSAKRLRLKH